ncbi:MAG: o-succinylbenzoate synthase [Opitutaceae bacterium]
MRLRFQFRRYRLPFRAVVRTAHGPWLEREGVIVRLQDASEGGSGAIGFGEAAPIPWFGTETIEEVEAGCRAIGEWIEVAVLEQVPKTLGCLRFALSSALAEMRGAEDEGTPTCSPALAIAALLPAGPAALAQITPKAEIGFRVFKWKVGTGDLADELALLDDVCAQLPSGGKLRLDANGAWNRRQAARWLERCADRPVEFVEQPIAADARGAEDLLLGLSGDYPTPIGLDESLIGDVDLEKWLGAGWPGIFVVKPALFGDAAAALTRLERANARVVFSSALETAVGAKSALRAAFAWKGERVPAPAMKSNERPEAGAAPPAESRHMRALGFGVWPLFADARFDGPFAPFLRYPDVQRIDSVSVWTALEGTHSVEPENRSPTA